MKTRLRRLACACALLAAGSALAGEMVFIAPTNHAMPLAQFKDGRIVGGIIYDLGEAIARKLGRQARFISVPSKRVGIELAAGEADALCYVLPNWIDGQFNWSRPLIPNGVVVIAHPDAPVIHTLRDLDGRRVGTVIGYRYPEVEAVLGKGFIRDDAPDSEHTFSKLSAGRTNYAIVEQAMLAWQSRSDKSVHVRSDLVYVTFKAKCAFSRAGRVPFAQPEHAVDVLLEQGAVEEILARYR
jgi:polar amino acid transport system substrate-binding protein